MAGFWDSITAALADSIGVVDAAILAARGTVPPLPILSPGYLALGYGDTGQQHKTRIRLTMLGDPYNTAQMETEAQAWADSCASVLNTTQEIDTWYAYDADKNMVQQGLLGTSVNGTNTNITLGSQSFTETLTGHGYSGGPGLIAGEARMRLFPHATAVPNRGERYRIIASYTPLQQLALFLVTSTVVWADFYGQKAGLRGHAPIQQNAYAQNKQGW